MATRRRSRKQRRLRRWTANCAAYVRRALTSCRTALRRLYRRLRGRRPAVIVDARPREAWQVRRLIRRTARAYGKALGTRVPEHLAIIAQRFVFDGHQVSSLLQAFEAGGRRRYVIQLALSVDGRDVSNAELVAALRFQLAAAMADTIGEPVLSIALDLDRTTLPRTGGSIVELRPQPPVASNGHDLDPFALSRVTDYHGGEAS